MIRKYFICLLTLCISHVLSAQIIDDITIFHEDPVEGEDIISRFVGEFPGGAYEIERIGYSIRDNSIFYIIIVEIRGVGADVMTPFSHDHSWGELSEGEWHLTGMVRIYEFDDEMEEPELVDEEFIGRHDIEIGEAENNVRFFMSLAWRWSIISDPIIPNERDIPQLFSDQVEADDVIFVKDYLG